ncbi:hypothetical protein [Synechococcus sp. NB0720_010]|uniref:hypothetical protein n=1 Tax=Synechococcus sp. NB0720_010 TaxID=2907159 RepID=UPI001FF9E743|nr:hypothetical protein [Synechococcus sp. NB0720_010]UPH91070.1 hypothetical protein LY254_05170 [Synechococcus sp. NB0720_010]
MTSDAEIREHNEKVRVKFRSLLEVLVLEDGSPLEARDESNQEETRKLFKEEGKSDFEHQSWRETEMLPEMIRLHINKYLKLNPAERHAFYTGLGQSLSFEEKMRFEEDVDADGLSDSERLKGRRLIAPTHSRRQLETWAAEIFLTREKKSHTRQKAGNDPTPAGNRNPELNYEELMNKAVIVKGTREEKRMNTRGTANKAINRALKGKNKSDLPIKIQNCGNLDKYEISSLGEPKPCGTNGEMQISPTDCLYRKISSKPQDQD